MNRMTIACLAGLAFAGELAAWSTIMWYKNKGPKEKKRIKRAVAEEEPNEALVEQLA